MRVDSFNGTNTIVVTITLALMLGGPLSKCTAATRNSTPSDRRLSRATEDDLGLILLRPLPAKTPHTELPRAYLRIFVPTTEDVHARLIIRVTIATKELYYQP